MSQSGQWHSAYAANERRVYQGILKGNGLYVVFRIWWFVRYQIDFHINMNVNQTLQKITQ